MRLENLLAGALLFSGASLAAAQQTELVYLSGRGSDDAVAWEFYCTGGRKSGSWTTIPVPSNWELHGFGTYNYGHDSEKAAEQGRYRRRFEAPLAWKGKRVVLVFDGAMTDTEVLYLRLFTPRFAADAGLATAPFSQGDVSFLHGIPAIGNKFQAAAALGPSGSRNRASGELSGTLYFFFGWPPP